MLLRTISLLLISVAAVTAGPKERVAPIYQAQGNVAVSGYDAVAYFSDNKPVQGSAQFTHEYMGAKFQFQSAANRDKFASDPAKYAPQFGGYCSWAVSQGYTAPADPTAWKIVDGKLYLNYNKSVQGKWEKNIPKFIQDGQNNWPQLHK
jgi:YHS domain-containing protein